jgi:hypothetical protein
MQLLNLKRGVGELVSSWAPSEQKGFQPVVKRVYGALDAELDNAVPGTQEINQKLSSLIPARTRANIASNAAPITQRIAGRMARPTGALAGAGIGSALGYREGGREGALAGGIAGLVAPEILASPTVQMTGARAAQGAAPYALPFLRGLSLLAANSGQPQPGQSLPPNLPWINFLRATQ